MPPTFTSPDSTTTPMPPTFTSPDSTTTITNNNSHTDSPTPTVPPHPATIEPKDRILGSCLKLSLARMIVARYGSHYESNPKYHHLSHTKTINHTYQVRKMATFVAAQLVHNPTQKAFSIKWLESIVQRPTETEATHSSTKRALSSEANDLPNKRTTTTSAAQALSPDIISAVRAVKSYNTLHTTTSADDVRSAFVDWMEEQEQVDQRKLSITEWYQLFRHDVLTEDANQTVEVEINESRIPDYPNYNNFFTELQRLREVNSGDAPWMWEAIDSSFQTFVFSVNRSHPNQPFNHQRLWTLFCSARSSSVDTAHTRKPTLLRKPPPPPIVTYQQRSPISFLQDEPHHHHHQQEQSRISASLAQTESLLYHLRPFIQASEVPQYRALPLPELDQQVRARVGQALLEDRLLLMVRGYARSMVDEERVKLEHQVLQFQHSVQQLLLLRESDVKARQELEQDRRAFEAEKSRFMTDASWSISARADVRS